MHYYVRRGNEKNKTNLLVHQIPICIPTQEQWERGIKESQVPALRASLKKLGYPMSDEDLSTMECFSTTAKSFVSCAVGKMNT